MLLPPSLPFSGTMAVVGDRLVSIPVIYATYTGRNKMPESTARFRFTIISKIGSLIYLLFLVGASTMTGSASFSTRGSVAIRIFMAKDKLQGAIHIIGGGNLNSTHETHADLVFDAVYAVN